MAEKTYTDQEIKILKNVAKDLLFSLGITASDMRGEMIRAEKTRSDKYYAQNDGRDLVEEKHSIIDSYEKFLSGDGHYSQVLAKIGSISPSLIQENPMVAYAIDNMRSLLELSRDTRQCKKTLERFENHYMPRQTKGIGQYEHGNIVEVALALAIENHEIGRSNTRAMG